MIELRKCKYCGAEFERESQPKRGRPQVYCVAECRYAYHLMVANAKRQAKIDAIAKRLCAKCNGPMLSQHRNRKYCESCSGYAKRPAETPGIRICTTCQSNFYAISKSGPLPLRCNFCKQRGTAWILRYCTWCGDLFGSTRRNASMCQPECRASYAASGGATHFRASQRQTTKICAYCKKEFRTSNSTRTHCDIRCTLKDRPWKPEGMKAKGMRSSYAKRRNQARRAGDKDLTTYSIWKAEGGHCRLCNKQTIDPTTPRALKPAKRDAWASLDHIKPLSAGGTHTWDNAQLLCYPCNSGKVHTDRVLWGGAVKILNVERATVSSDEFVNPFGGVGLPNG